ncbi:HNH endonuclease [Oenococcus oeni]|uniref:HNH endonuclease n=1 Tax=Oenococcus oeni TaxID=1247 RepID=UPI0021B424F8|nr:HNH endonuclease [Oenococcus oeni]
MEKRLKWHNAHKKDYTHKYNTIKRVRNDVKREQNGFYHTKQWQTLRQQVLDKQHYLCQYCLLHERVTPAKTVDHRVSLVFDPDKKADVSNLDTICPECHHLKTEWEQTYYFKNGIKQDVDEIKDIKMIDYVMRKVKKSGDGVRL